MPYKLIHNLVCLLVAMCGLVLTPFANAKDDLAVYAELSRTASVRLSPNGKYVAIVQPYKGNAGIFIYNLENPSAKVKAIPAPEDAIVKSVFWGGNKNVILRAQFPREQPDARTHNKKLLLNRYVSYNIETNKPTILLKKIINEEGARNKIGSHLRRSRLVRNPGFIVHPLPNDDRHILMGRGKYLAPNYYLIHYKVDLDNGSTSIVRRLDWKTQTSILNPKGDELLARSEYERTSNTYKIYAVNGKEEKLIFTKTYPKSDNPYILLAGLTPDKTKLIMVDTEAVGNRLFTIDRTTGTRGAYSLSISPPRGLTFSPIYDQYSREPIGIQYIDDYPEQRFFAQPFAKWHKGLKKALPGKHVLITSWSKNREKVILFAEGPTDAGEYYLFEPNTKQLSPLGGRYPEIKISGRTVRVDYNARDGLKIPAYLVLPPGKTLKDGPFSLVVMPHGGPQARDSASFDFWAQYYAAHNIAVFKPNYRGSDGYGFNYVKKGHDEFGGKMVDDTIDGVKHLIATGIVDKDKICIAGASYGGYQAFALPTHDKSMFKCSISVSGVSELPEMLKWVAGRRGVGRNNSSSKYWFKWMGHYMDNKDKLKAFSPALNLDGVSTEFLILHGELDPVVPYEQSEIMAKALKEKNIPYKMIELTDDDHNLSRPASRRILLEESRKLFKKYLDWKD